MSDEKRLMSEEEFLSEMRLRTLEAAAETNRLLRIDAEITESVRDIIATVREEIAQEPKLFFKIPGESQNIGTGASIPTSGQEEIKISQSEQKQKPTPVGNLMIDLINKEKDLIKELIRNLFNF